MRYRVGMWSVVVLAVVGISVLGAHFRVETARAGTSTITPGVCSLSGARIGRAAPAVGDIDNDGVKEIVVAGSDGMVYAMKPDCSMVPGWPVQVNNFFVPPLVATKSDTQDIESTPALADLDGDGRLEVIVTVGWMPQYHQNGGVIVFEDNGAVKPGWPKVTLDVNGAGDPPWNPDGFTDGVFSTPAIGDIDGDGQPEIVYGAFDKCIYAWHANGTPVAGWWDTANNRPARCLIDTIWSSPALADLDGDGVLDIVIGTDADPNYAGGSLWALKGNNTVLWTVYTTQVIVSSPAIGDINNDGYPEIVVGTGDYYPQGYKGTSDGHKVYAFDRFGNSLPGWPQPTAGNMISSPSLADVDGDGKLEVLIGCGGEGDYDPATASCNKLYAWRYNGQPLTGYPTTITRANPWSAGQGSAGMPYVPVVADYNNNGVPDVFLVEAGSWGVSVFPYNNPGSVDPFFAYSNNTLQAAPVIDNVYNDNRSYMVAAGADATGSKGAVYIWQISNTVAGARPWPMARHDVKRTGYYPMPPRLSMLPSALYVMHPYGPGSEVTALRIHNAGDGSMNWSANTPANVTLSSSSGTVMTQTLLRVTIAASGYLTGTTSLGNITVSGTSAGNPVAGSPATIPVTLWVGPVFRSYLPAVLRPFGP